MERYRYTAFGEREILSPEGELRQTSQVANPWQYAGKRLDPESGLIAFGLRYYDPVLGRWITPDPAGFEDGPNLYAYVHNSPLLCYDQFGLFSIFDSGHQEFCTGNDRKFFQPILASDGFFEGSRDFFRSIFSKREETIFPKITYDDDFENRHPCEVQSKIFDLGLPEPSVGRIMFINGMWNTYKDALGNVEHLSQLCGGHNVHAVYNATHGKKVDAVEGKTGLSFIATTPVRLLHQQWNDSLKIVPQMLKF